MRTMSGGKCPAEYCQNKTAFGYCKTTVCINPMYSNIGSAQYGQGAQKVVMTNADRIRAMTDEELADEILRWFNWLNAVEWDDKRIINWLREEAE